MKVEILNGEEFKKLFKSWGTFACQCYNTPDKFAERVGKSCLETGHTSGSRSRFLEMRITGVSRAMVDQLIRSEIGVVKNVMSQRYVFGDFEYYTDPVIKSNSRMDNYYKNAMQVINGLREELKEIVEEETGYKGENLNQVVRGLNPMAMHSAVTIAFDVEALIQFSHERTCMLAQSEIRHLASMIIQEAIDLVPELESHLVSKCEFLLWCPESEKRSCGRYPTKIKLMESIKGGH